MKKHRKLLTFGVVICLVAGLVAGIFYYKQAEEERRLSHTTKNGCISAIVPMCSHVDSTEHDVDVIVTEQGCSGVFAACVTPAHAPMFPCR